jgi:GAF domain-containing protein
MNEARRRRQFRWVWMVTILTGIVYSLVDLAVFQLAESAVRLGVRLGAIWALLLMCAGLVIWKFDVLFSRIQQNESAREEAMAQVRQLEAQNALLQTMAGSRDVTLAFQTLARHIARLVPCHRVGLALLNESGLGFQTYTARVGEAERRSRPRPELEFPVDRTVIGQVLRSREPMIVDDVSTLAQDHLDANVLQSAGLQSALLLPLVSRGRAVGTLHVVSRAKKAFSPADIPTVLPIAELLAVGFVAQQFHAALGKYRSMEVMSDLTLSIGNEINSAVQIIVGHCDLLERGYPDPALQQDLAMVVRQAQRISELLQKLRATAAERLRAVAATVSDSATGIPSSPEAVLPSDETRT